MRPKMARINLKSPFTILLCIVGMSIIPIVIYKLTHDVMTLTTLKFKQSSMEPYISEHNVDNSDIRSMSNNRVSRLKEGCMSHRRNLYNITPGQSGSSFLHSSKANFTVCKVAKSGSTFWTLIYLVLEYGLQPAKIFRRPRNEIHTLEKVQSFKMIKNQSSSLNILVSRDPYSRLFSAYIDKFFLLAFARMAKRIATQHGKSFYFMDTGYCGYNVTFQEFLDSVTDAALNGRTINSHWSPVYTMCQVCHIDYQFVALQDTLTRDTEHIIQNMLNISQSQKDSLQPLFHGKEGVKKTMEGVLDTLLNHRDIHSTCCPDQIIHLHKIWISLQIQGYIRADLEFPWRKFRTKQAITGSLVKKLILESMTLHPLTREDKTRQRSAYLVNAYTNISSRTIHKIQLMYEMDFIMFGFDKNPPLNVSN